MSEGIKETKELLIAGNEVGVLAVQRLKDGFQIFDDFSAFFTAFTKDEAFKAKLKEAWDAKEKIPAELSDLSVFEILELAKVEVDYVPKYLAALKP